MDQSVHDLTARRPQDEPWYRPAGNEVTLFEHCHKRGLAVMLKGPTGSGTTRGIVNADSRR